MTAGRRLAGGYADAWRRSGPRGRIVLVVGGAIAATLAGAFLFGAWHVVVGGLVKGNPRAAAFGVGLAAASGLALAVLAYVGRRVAIGEPPSAQGPGPAAEGSGPAA